MSVLGVVLYYSFEPRCLAFILQLAILHLLCLSAHVQARYTVACLCVCLCRGSMSKSFYRLLVMWICKIMLRFRVMPTVEPP